MTAVRRWLAPLFAAAVIASSASGAAAGELVLYRSNSKAGVGFFVRGAQPGERIVLLASTDGARAADFRIPDVIADATGGAFVPLDADALAAAESQRISVQAFVNRGTSDSPDVVFSNPALLRDPPLLWLVVDRADSSSLVMRFDAEQERLEEWRRGPARRDGLIASLGAIGIVKEDSALVPLDEGASHRFLGGEEPIDLAATADQSALIALTREAVGDGHTLLRVRLLDCAPTGIGREIGSFEVLRSTSRVLSAWLVAGDDSHRFLVADRSGLVREIMFGEQLTRGVTLLPLAPDGREELADCALAGDWLAVTTRVAGGAHGNGRLFVVDLAHRTPPTEHALAARPLDLALIAGPDGLVACIATDAGRIERIALADGARRSLEVPGVARLAATRDRRLLFAAASGASSDGAALFVVRPDFAEARRLPFGDLARGLPDMGLLEWGEREWLWFVERRFQADANRPGGALVDDHLWWAEIDRDDGSLKGTVGVQPIGGRLRGVDAR
jgi:hypothetical protein